MKYSRPVTSDLEYIAVQGSLVGRKGPQLTTSLRRTIVADSLVTGIPLDIPQFYVT
jgi:hypothetical protein